MIEKLENVRLVLKANVYFGGKVISHTAEMPDGSRRTAGVIFPGTYHFTTEAPERMDILAGACRIQRAGETTWTSVRAGEGFEVPGRSAFEIEVAQGLAEYLCTYR